jgi:hypothetical protein
LVGQTSYVALPEEFQRQRRLADQMITIYSVLRDRYARRATFLTLAIFFSSALLLTGTFMPDASLVRLGIASETIRLLLGVCSAIVFFASIAELCLRWREVSQVYSGAAERLAVFKARAREIAVRGATATEADLHRTTAEYNAAIEHSPRVPDRHFVKLKAYHLRKLRLSRLCDEAVGCPVWILRCRLWLEGLRQIPRAPGK